MASAAAIELGQLMGVVCKFIQDFCVDPDAPGSFRLQETRLRWRRWPVRPWPSYDPLYATQFVFVWRDVTMNRDVNRSTTDLHIAECRPLLQQYFAKYCMHVVENWDEFKVSLALTLPHEHAVHEFVQYWQDDRAEEREERVEREGREQEEADFRYRTWHALNREE